MFSENCIHFQCDHTYEAGIRASITFTLFVQRQHGAGQYTRQKLIFMRVIVQAGGSFAAN